MFRTAIRETENPEIQPSPLASAPVPSRRLRLSLKGTLEPPSHSSGEEERCPGSGRPGTSPLQTLALTGRSSRMVDLHAVEQVENELQSQFRGEMCGYLRRKLKGLVGRRQQQIGLTQSLHRTLDSELQGHWGVGALDQFYSSFQGEAHKVEKGIGQAYVCNTKQKIVRTIHRSREQQGDFRELHRSIQTRQEERRTRRTRVLRGQFRVSSLEESRWDKEWQVQVARERQRYLSRLQGKTRAGKGSLWQVDFGH